MVTNVRGEVIPLTLEPRCMTAVLGYADWMTDQDLSPSTIDQRVEFAEWRLREWKRWDLEPRVIVKWLSTYSGWTKLTYYGHLRSIYRWQLADGLLDVDPMDSIRQPPTPAPNPSPLEPDEVVAVMDGVTGHLRAWMLLPMLAGLRVHEVAKFDGIDITQSTIRVYGKGRQYEVVPTHPVLWDLAQEYPRRGMWFPSPARPGKSYSADHISGQIADRFRAAGVQRGSIHRLRATYGTALLDNGANIRVVQKLMRHKSVATTERYLGVRDDQLVSAIRGLAA